MTREDIIGSATANGYDISGKTDEQILSDWSFFKAAFKGFEEEVFSTLRQIDKKGFVKSALVAWNTAARVRFNLSLDWLDAGKALEEIWDYVAKGSKPKSKVLDKHGRIILSALD